MKLYNKSIFEIIYNIKYFNIDKSVKDIKDIKKLDNETFKKWQYNKKMQIAIYHYKHNNIYKKLVTKENIKKWETLPIIEKKHLQNKLIKLISIPYTVKKLYINKTSGSSGKPFTFTKDYYTQSRVWASRKIFLEENQLSLSSKQAMFYRKSQQFPKNIKEKIKDIIMNRVRIDSTNLSEIYLEKYFLLFKKTKFEYIYGYSSAIVLFCRYLLKKNIILKDFCPTLKLVVVTAEVCTNDDKKIIEKATGVKTLNEYGSADLGMIAFECKYNHFHIVEENLYVETTNSNELLITDLYNKSFPFVKYKLGDIALISQETCKCGNRNKYIYNFLGRSNDTIILKNKNKIPGYSFYQKIRPILENSNLLKEFFIKQTALDKFELDVVSERKFPNYVLEELEKTVNQYLKQKNHIIINYKEQIEKPETGKLKHFYSQLNIKDGDE
jgi:phenylacetate-CoA ligase